MHARERDQLDAAMGALADGDRSAFDTVFRVSRPLVERYVRRLVSDAGARDDLVQTTLEKVFQNAHTYDRERDAAAWIIALASWEIRSYRRDDARRRARFDADGVIDQRDAGADVERDVFAREALAVVSECIGELSPTDREVLTAALGEERPGGSTFRKRLERAIARLRSKWSERYGTHAS